MILDIKSVGEPILRYPARPLTREEVLSPTIQRLIEDMRETMHKAPGVGLAAPQVGIGVQLAVIEDRAEYMEDIKPEILAERERKPIPFQVVINPVLTLIPGAQAEFFEGCLSLGGFTALVKRAHAVRVECFDGHGEPCVIQTTGWYARILQHEIDHLYGRLYVDSMQTRSFCTLDNYAKHWREPAISEVKSKLGI